MTKLLKWFGDESVSESSDSSDSEWEGVNRTARNEEKKKRRKAAMKLREHQTSQKAQMMIGFSPISATSVEYHQKQGTDYNDAKIKALHEYLNYFLNFEQDELMQIGINDTKMAANDNTLYVAFTNLEDIKEINHRFAECRNNNIFSRNFVPPQYYQRYMHINAKCTEMRNADRNLKTKMRFGPKGIEVLMKTRGTEEPYRIVSLDNIDDLHNIPKYDHTRSWNPKGDKPPRKTPNYRPDRTYQPSASKIPGKTNTHQLSRSNSNSNTETMSKKQRTDADNMEQMEDAEVEVDEVEVDEEL